MKEKKSNKEILDSYDYLANAACSNDYTGLIPSLPKSEEEREAYEALYPSQPKPDSDTDKHSY